MMDLIALAFAADTTRVFSFKLGRDASGRAYPESGVNTGFHNASHHGEREDRILDFAKINKYHVSMVPYLLEKLKNTQDGDGNLLDNSLVIYGSPMADSNIHNHKRAPLFVAGHAGGRLKGGVHIKAPDGTPMANSMLTMLHVLGCEDLQQLRRQHGRARSEQRRAGADDGSGSEGLIRRRRSPSSLDEARDALSRVEGQGCPWAARRASDFRLGVLR